MKLVTRRLNKQLLQDLDISKLSKIAEGYYGEVYKLVIHGNVFALKVFKDTMRKDIENGEVAAYDYEILKALNGSKYYPTVHAYEETKWMITDYVLGFSLRTLENPEDYLTDLKRAYRVAVNSGWFPDDVKGNNLQIAASGLKIIDVGSFLPAREDVEFDIDSRTKFVIENVHVFPSVRDEKPYELKELQYDLS